MSTSPDDMPQESRSELVADGTQPQVTADGSFQVSGPIPQGGLDLEWEGQMAEQRQQQIETERNGLPDVYG